MIYVLKKKEEFFKVYICIACFLRNKYVNTHIYTTNLKKEVEAFTHIFLFQRKDDLFRILLTSFI